MEMKPEDRYEIQYSDRRDTVWIHCIDGSTVGRFGRMGVDLHNSVTEMLEGATQCRLCTHGRPSMAEWELFRSKALEWWGVIVPADAIDPALLAATSAPHIEHP